MSKRAEKIKGIIEKYSSEINGAMYCKNNPKYPGATYRGCEVRAGNCNPEKCKSEAISQAIDRELKSERERVLDELKKHIQEETKWIKSCEKDHEKNGNYTPGDLESFKWCKEIYEEIINKIEQMRDKI